ncbi:hypothetical protein ABS852_07795, partial [Klebsiella pneumoniae]|uniref:hypothetical protein n=1 Tax=Klebsiella pneumoniae TaxID=573 RepID=UPI003315B583
TQKDVTDPAEENSGAEYRRREVKSFISGSLPKVRLSYSPPVVKYYPPVDKAANKKDHGMLAGVADHAGR